MAPHRLLGGCRCGAVSLQVELSREPGSCHPRACDCDFCREREAAYVSDPAGRLRMRVRSPADVRIERQGSLQAEFLSCQACGTLLVVRWQDGDRAYGAVNARALADRAAFGAEQPASPKQLGAGQKTERWKALWFADVGLDIG